VEQAVMRLGKLCWSLGLLERSIRHRDELAGLLESRGERRAAANFWLLVANTYDERLGRQADALLYYRRAFDLVSTDEDSEREMMRERLLRCEQRLAAEPPGTRLLELLERYCLAPGDAALLAVRLALATDFNLWHFEVRSFCAWYEQVWGDEIARTIEGSRTVPVWALISIHQLIEFARTARARGDLDDAVALLGLARRFSEDFDLPQGGYLALRELARCRQQGGEPEDAVRCSQEADSLKAAFQEWAAAEGIPRFASPQGELSAWSHLGVVLSLHLGQLVDAGETRVITTCGRAADEYLLMGDRPP
jgi:tetratricopeptide (TPR) repeat protein